MAWTKAVRIILQAAILIALLGCTKMVDTKNPYSSSIQRTNLIGKDHEDALLLNGAKFARLPQGQFVMGSENGYWDEKPSHSVKIGPDIWMQTSEVTVQQWLNVMGELHSQYDHDAFLPVQHLSWNDCQTFIARLNARSEAFHYRLPTEAEWEYACQAGSKGRFCFGDTEESLRDHAWFSANSGWRIHPVGMKKPNSWGLYDMHGNVAEWCEDTYQKGFVDAPIDGAPWVVADAEFRVLKGGSCVTDADKCRSSYRAGNLPSITMEVTGFRLVRKPIR